MKSTHTFDMDDGTTITITFKRPMVDVKCEKGREWLWGWSEHQTLGMFHPKMTSEQKAFVRTALRMIAKWHNTTFNLANLGG